MSGLIGHRGIMMGGAAAPAATYLDQLGVQPRAVLWLGKKISTATLCMRIRRSSDNAEQDIGFVGDAVDTATIASFVGANNAFIKTWYDQTANGEDATQTTNSKQPKIVNAGSYLGYAEFLAASGTSMTISSLTMGNPQCAIFAKFQKASYVATQNLWELSTNFTGQAGKAFVGYAAGGEFGAGHSNANEWVVSNTAAQKLWSVLHDKALAGTNECAAWEAGVAPSKTLSNQASTTDADTFVTTDMYLGSRAGTTAYADMQISGFTVYNSNASGIRTSVESILA